MLQPSIYLNRNSSNDFNKHIENIKAEVKGQLNSQLIKTKKLQLGGDHQL